MKKSGCSAFLDAIFDTVREWRENNSRLIKISGYVLLNIVVIGYFAYATYYFIEHSKFHRK